MKKIYSAILVIFLVSACGVPATPSPIPTEMPIPTVTFTVTNMPVPTSTLAHVPTPIPTTIPIPMFMNEFVAKGYDQQVTKDNAIHVVLSESSLVYAQSESGISFQDIVIFSWFTVSYFDNDNQYREGIVLNNVCRVDGDNAGRFTSALTDGSQITPTRTCPGMPYFRGQNRDLLSALLGEYQILKAFLGTGNDTNKDLVYDGVFPESSKNPQNLNIPGIGEVMPITIFRLPDSPRE